MTAPRSTPNVPWWIWRKSVAGYTPQRLAKRTQLDTFDIVIVVPIVV
jgi:hypothetical protein